MRSALALVALTGCTVGLDWSAPALPYDASAAADGSADAPDGARAPDASGGCASPCRGATPYCCGGQCRSACCADAQCGGGRRCCDGQCQSRCG